MRRLTQWRLRMHQGFRDCRTYSTNKHPLSTIRLTRDESFLFDFLLYVQRIHAPTTQLRVAGGWVRDKLRGEESSDIDIVLDNLYGREFANHITTFQRKRCMTPSSVGVVKANAEKSKHLEVAQVRLHGFMIDFVHLRSEKYTSESRIPTLASFAAPEHDALRRDLTINALFYNLSTKQVEDWTGHGISDLQNQIIRTPLPPYQTFLDDPLRVLRVIRFASEFGYTIDPAISDALLKDDEIREAMTRIVSRERIGIEIKKMLSGTNPARAFSLLSEYRLLDRIFQESTEVWTPQAQEQSLLCVLSVQEAYHRLLQERISYIEATAAILIPLVVESSHKIRLQDTLNELSCAEIRGSFTADETILLESSLSFLNQRDNVILGLGREHRIEQLKTTLKWPKAVAKGIVWILEAIATFPTVSTSTQAWHVQMALWSLRYRNVLTQSIVMIGTIAELEDSHVRSLLTIANAYVDETPHADGNKLRQKCPALVGPSISQALEVLAVFKTLTSSSDSNHEMAFLDKLIPHLVK